MGDPIEARIQRLEDRAAIGDLLARYAMAVDDRDLDLVASLFCEDAVFGRWNGTDRAEGRAEIRRFYRDRLGRVGPSFHYPHIPLIEFVAADEANGVVTAHAEMAVEGKLVVTGFRYQDRYHRNDDGVWRFHERLSRFYYMMTHDELHDHYGDEIRVRWPGTPMPADLPDQLESWQRFRAEVAEPPE